MGSYVEIYQIFNIVCIAVMTERNLNPKAACLKRREEEKGTEFLNAQSAYADRTALPLVVTSYIIIFQSINVSHIQCKLH